MPVARQRVAVIGAGMGGLAAAIDLACDGHAVTVFERAATPGGKIRQQTIGGHAIDVGPTVFTMRWVFDDLLGRAGADLDRSLALEPSAILARHGWPDGSRLDLHADLEASVAAVREFASPAEARRFRKFCAVTQRLFETLDAPFLRASKPANFAALLKRVGVKGTAVLASTSPMGTLASALRDQLRDPRLLQLFGRYATYCGSSPYAAPSTLMLIAHVERLGVWRVRGGMTALARCLADTAAGLGVEFRYGTQIERIRVEGGRATGVALPGGGVEPFNLVVMNGDVAALGQGLLTPVQARKVPRPARADRSQSALTFAMAATMSGFPLSHHTVFFSDDYRAEFDAVFHERTPPRAPTVYICAQDRGDDTCPADGPEPLFLITNAPADGDIKAYGPEEIAACQTSTFDHLSRCGLAVTPMPDAIQATTPSDYERLFPATGGALYGRASHGWESPFRRAEARSGIGGLYLAGGSVHPGPGVPMAALSGRLAAATIRHDLGSTPRSRPVAISGGMSTR